MKLLKKNNKPVTQENQYLLQEIALTKRALSAAYSNFDNATDPDLIDCYIYEVNSALKRYRFLLNQAQRMELFLEEEQIEKAPSIRGSLSLHHN